MITNSPNDASTSGILRSSGLFRGVDDELLGDILHRMHRETWARKRTVAAEDENQRFHVILSGRLQVVRINEETGRIVTLFLLAPGDAFDMLQLLTGTPCEGTFVARDDLDLLTLPVDEMRQWISAHPEINRSFLPYLGQQIRNLTHLAGDLALHDTETRLAHLIMRHVDNEAADSHHLKLINDLSHEVLAEMIGSVRAVVNRQLQHWRKQGIVSLDHGHIHIEKLQALLNRTRDHKLLPRKFNL